MAISPAYRVISSAKQPVRTHAGPPYQPSFNCAPANIDPCEFWPAVLHASFSGVTFLNNAAILSGCPMDWTFNGCGKYLTPNNEPACVWTNQVIGPLWRRQTSDPYQQLIWEATVRALRNFGVWGVAVQLQAYLGLNCWQYPYQYCRGMIFDSQAIAGYWPVPTNLPMIFQNGYQADWYSTCDYCYQTYQYGAGGTKGQAVVSV